MTSVIISFYERLGHLLRCLDSLAAQADDFGEVIIADDGSGADTVDALQGAISRYPFPITHAWAEKDGFRVAATRNRGIRQAKGEYLVFFDCDFLILPDCIKAHLRAARRGRFVAGHCKYLPQDDTEALFAQPHDAESALAYYNELPERPLRRMHLRYRRRTLLMKMGLLSPRRQALGGHLSIHRSDIEAINGYDENFVGWGGEDEDLGIRLAMAGIHCVSAITRARVLHLWHPRELGNQHWSAGRNMDYFKRGDVSAVCAKGLTDKANMQPETR